MFDTALAPAEWSLAHQRLHTLMWSAFLDIETGFDSKVWRKRYHPLSIDAVSSDLLAHFNENAGIKLRPAFVKLAYWTLAPAMVGGDRPGAGEFRERFADLFGFDLAAMSSQAFDRPLLPPLPEIGLEEGRIRVEYARQAVRATVDCTVLTPFSALAPFVSPWECPSSPFWTELHGTEGDRKPAVRLPGGWEESSVLKIRTIDLETDVAVSPFGSRVDYSLREPPGGATPERSDVNREMGECRGYMLVEKLAGRPGACRVSARREASFLDFNHKHFRAETVMYWLAADLVAFADDARRKMS